MNNQRWFNLIYSCQLTWILRVLSLLLGGKLKAQLDQDSRIIEIASTQVRFLASCLNPATHNYLGLLTKVAVACDQQNSDKNPYIIEVGQSFRLKNNNAAILILSEPRDLQRLWAFGEYKHTEYIFCTPINFLALVISIPGLVKNLVLGRIKILGVDTLKDDWGIKQPTLLVKVVKRSTPKARRYISPVVGVRSFFASLNQKQVNYAILRWFEELPAIAPGEDIDMLVADEDIEQLESLIQQYPGIIPCDIYTVTGLPGTAYKNMAYYPPFVAEQILAGTILARDTFYVPNPEIHFYSLAYHAIYHKGHKSGIPWSMETFAPPEIVPEHEYREILTTLAQSLNIDVAITLKDLDSFLNQINWRPAEDTLARLDSSHLWVTNSVSADTATINQDIRGLAVFLIRQKALELGLVSEIENILTKEGFNLIFSRHLAPEAVKRVKYQVRGGNWGKGPWAESGGDPGIVIVALDLMPIEPTKADLAKQPHLSNSRITVKNKIRDWVNLTLPKTEQCNIVHSSDNETEAWNYLEIALPEECERIRQQVIQLRADFQTNQKIEQVLTRFGRRAKVEVIKYGDRLAVKKTFRPGCEKFCQREIYVSQNFASESAAIPEILDCGTNYLIYPYYDDVLHFQNRQSKLLPLKVAKQALQALQFFYDRGYAVIDFQPANIIVDRQTGLKILDFEFLYQYQAKPQSFVECYELAGIPDNFEGDKPDWQTEMSYETRWQPYVGLSLTSLLSDPIWLQHIKRLIFALTHLPFRLVKNQLQEWLTPKKWLKLSSSLLLLKQ